jgi:hypothetical protein
MQAVVKRAFKYSADGLTAVLLSEGENVDIDDRLFPGLEKEGWIKKARREGPRQTPSQDAPEGAGEAAEGADSQGDGKEGGAETPPGGPEAAQDAPNASQSGDGAAEGLQASQGAAESGASDPDAAGGVGGLYVRHIGRGKYAVFKGRERMTDEAMTQAEAEGARNEMLRAGSQS